MVNARDCGGNERLDRYDDIVKYEEETQKGKGTHCREMVQI